MSDVDIEFTRCPRCLQLVVITVDGLMASHREEPGEGQVLGPWCTTEALPITTTRYARDVS